MENHRRLLTECRFRSREIEFPHPHKSRVVKLFSRITMSEKAVPLGSEGVSVVQAQNFNVVEQPTRTLYRWQCVRQRWNMIARARESGLQ